MFTVSDSTKKVSILVPTALLPRSLRVKSREQLLSRLEVAIARRAGLLIIGHPKSGNTWLRSMLSRAYPLKCGLPRDLMVKAEELARADVLVADTPSPTLGGPTGAAVVGA